VEIQIGVELMEIVWKALALGGLGMMNVNELFCIVKSGQVDSRPSSS
jgi:hypothetical protein